MGSQTQSMVPIIDLSKNLKAGTETWRLACKDVREAMEEYGCFVAVYDKVSFELHNSVFKVVKDLFDLPTHIKTRNTSEKTYHGYFGQYSFLPLYESLGIDNPTSLEGTQAFANVMWPAGNGLFCESVSSYSNVVKEIDEMVTRMLYDGYGVASDSESNIGSTNYLLRCFKYKVPEMNETNLGLHSHTDLTFISIIHQHHISGLQIQTSDGEWIDVQPLPSSFVVMAGDALMAWSNDRLRACSHRVILNGDKTRYSLGLFSFKKEIISVPEEMVDEEHPLKYKPFDHFDFLRFDKANASKDKSSVSRMKDYCGV